MDLLTILFNTWLAVNPTWPVIPDDQLTPGAIGSTDETIICTPGYSATVRLPFNYERRLEVFQRYRLSYVPWPKAEDDHRVPLELGGADVPANLWPQSGTTCPWSFHIKDRLENYIHAQVCTHHTLTIQQAQAIFLGDWTQFYLQHLGLPKSKQCD